MKYYNSDVDSCADRVDRLGDGWFNYCKIFMGFTTSAEDYILCKAVLSECGTADSNPMTIDEDVLCKDLETYFPIRKNN